jgi:chitinase
MKDQIACQPKKRDYLVSVYFGNWKIYMRKFELCKTPLDKIDRIYYAFLNPSSGECVLNDPWGDIQKPGPEGAVCGATK